MTVLGLLLLSAVTLPSQSPPGGTDTAVTPAGMRRHIEIIAHDSMQGRDTPGPGLERAARYVVAEFQRLGLRPAGEGEDYEQRWGLSRWIPDTAASHIVLAGPGWRRELRLGVDVRYVGGSVDGREIRGETVLLDHSAPDDPAGDAELQDRVLLLPVDYSRPLPSRLQERVDRLAQVAGAVVILSNRDSSTFATRLHLAARPRWSPDFRIHEDGAPVLEVHRRALAPRELAGGGQATVRLERKYLSRATAPNLVGIVEGADPALREEYVAVTAHVDGVGIRPGAADSINNGADDNASGLAALLEVAEAFGAPGARPRRSLLFLVPSGEEKGLWGSAHFVAHPTVPLDRIVAVLNLDLIGRNWTDSVIVVGPEFSTLGETLRRVGEARPELRMAPIRDRWPEERIFYRSDHYHFARRGVPILFFTSGTHPDYHQPTDSPDRVDAEKASRVARLLYHVARAVADDPERPRWSPDSYRRIVQEKSP